MQTLLRTMCDPIAEMIGLSMPRLGLKRHNASHGVVNALQLTKTKPLAEKQLGSLWFRRLDRDLEGPGLNKRKLRTVSFLRLKQGSHGEILPHTSAAPHSKIEENTLDNF